MDLDGDRDVDGWLDDDHDHDGWSDGNLIAGEPLLGKGLYRDHCQRCHGLPPDGHAVKGAHDPGRIKEAILENRGGMAQLIGLLDDQDLADIAAWLGERRE